MRRWVWRAAACAQAECLRYVGRKFPWMLSIIPPAGPVTIIVSASNRGRLWDERLRKFTGLGVHGRNLIRHGELCLGLREHVFDRYARRGLDQRRAAIGKGDDREFGND